MLRPSATTQFRRDRRLAKSRGKNLANLDEIMRKLAAQEPLAARHRKHVLRGPWDGHWEGRIEPDWLLLWCETEGDIVFVRTGTYADLGGVALPAHPRPCRQPIWIAELF